MAKRIKRTKVNRGGDNTQKSDGTAGLMALRIIIIIVIILFIGGVAALCAFQFKRDAEAFPSISSDTDIGGVYHQFTAEEEESLLEYCNSSSTISEYYTVDLSEYNGVEVNSLMMESLQKMVLAAQKDGIEIEVLQGYMSFEECQEAFENLKAELQAEGYSPAEAETAAKAACPPGGSNEYQTGLLIKCSDLESEEFEKTEVYKWLYKNGIDYGFINRYTEEKKSYTGRDEDLTLFRFVGKDNAQKMRSFGMCLEEYSDYCSYH